MTGVICFISSCFQIHGFLAFKPFTSQITTGKHTVLDGNVTTYVYEFSEKFGYELTSFYFTDHYGKWLIVESLFKDVFVLIIILVLNVLILFKMKQTTNRRKALAGGAHKESTMSATALRSVINAQAAEKKRNIMILLTGLNYGVSHIGFAISIIRTYFFANSDFWACFHVITYWLQFMNSIDALFFYYFFNNHFKKFIHHDFKLIFGKLLPSGNMYKTKEMSLENRSSSMATTTQ
jgi:hypothetical protein